MCSVLEPGRSLTLAERGGEGAEVIVAAPGFRILATMNPGGDYGKKCVCAVMSIIKWHSMSRTCLNELKVLNSGCAILRL
jgi:hypothetical protein